eukprot:7967971-Alexandrium_andersonii.AAC.1
MARGWCRPFAVGPRPLQRARPSCRKPVLPGALLAGAGAVGRLARGGPAVARRAPPWALGGPGGGL